MTPGLLNLAKWILAEEADGPDAATADVAARAWERLSRRISQLFTVSGSQSLGKRAVYLAKDDFPFLMDANGNIPLERLGPVLEGRDEEQAAAAAETVYAHLIGLLVTFIGEDLAMRAIRDVWPGASLHEPGTMAQEVKQ